MSGAASASAPASSGLCVYVLPEVGYMVPVPYFHGMNASNLRSSFPINGIPAQSHIYQVTDSKLWDALLKNSDGVTAFLKTNPPRVVDSVAPLSASTCFVAKSVGGVEAAPELSKRLNEMNTTLGGMKTTLDDIKKLLTNSAFPSAASESGDVGSRRSSTSEAKASNDSANLGNVAAAAPSSATGSSTSSVSSLPSSISKASSST